MIKPEIEKPIEMEDGKFYVVKESKDGTIDITAGPFDRTDQAIDDFVHSVKWDEGECYMVIRMTKAFHIETTRKVKVVTP